MPAGHIRQTLAGALALVLGMVMATAPAAANDDKAKGEQLFRQRCQACHSASSAKPSPLGPNLAGVVGRKAGSTPYAYSPALKASGLTWTRASLDKFLSGPARMVPGTKMSVVVSDAAQRKALLHYLSTTR